MDYQLKKIVYTHAHKNNESKKSNWMLVLFSMSNGTADRMSKFILNCILIVDVYFKCIRMVDFINNGLLITENFGDPGHEDFLGDP